MPTSKDEILEEFGKLNRLKEIFEGKNANYLSDITSISYILAGGPTSVAPGLELLEAALFNTLHIKANSSLTSRFTNLFTSPQKTKKTLISDAQKYFSDWATRRSAKVGEIKTPTYELSASKALSSVLTAMEKEAGFTLLDNDQTKIYYAVLDKKTFKSEAQTGMQFKDIINPDHGEYTHRIQWYVALHSHLKLLTPRPETVNLFKFINSTADLWVWMFDRNKMDNSNPPNTDSPHDFRCPENFNNWLTEDAQTKAYPLLCHFLSERRKKRESSIDPIAYMASKYFNTKISSFNQLSDEDIQLVVATMQTNGGIYKRDIHLNLINPLKKI